MANDRCSSNTPSVNKEAVSVVMPRSLFQDATHLYQLINYIEERLNAIAKPEEAACGRQPAPSVRVASSVQFGMSLLDELLRLTKNKICYMFVLDREILKMLSDVLKEATQVHWEALGLSAVACVLDQIDLMSATRSQCIRLLTYFFVLSQCIKQLNEQLPEERKKLNDVICFIVKGCVMCVSQTQSSGFSRFCPAFLHTVQLKCFESELGRAYPNLKITAAFDILKQRPTLIPLALGEYPGPVGIEDARDEVIRILDMTDQASRAVVIYGEGGIGKTTLATTVFETVNLSGYKRCRVDIDLNCSINDLKSLQQKILQQLFDKSISLRSCAEGREHLSKAFKEGAFQPVFLFIDNALRRNDLQELLPEDLSCLPGKSRMLVTTRKLDEINIPVLPRYAYLVNSLSFIETRRLLCKKVLGSADASFDKDVDIDSLVDICGGIPLVVELVGSRLVRDGSNVSYWVKFLKERLQEGKGDLTETAFDCVYDSLEDHSYKEAFLDIASFFHNWYRQRVAQIVGEVQLKALEDAALAKITDEGRVNMHDIVRARGRWLSKSTRIADMESLTEASSDTQNLQQMKGIWLSDKNEGFEFEAEHLDLTSKTLRVLYLGWNVKVKGRCKRPFEDLRYLQLQNDESNAFLSMNRNNLKRLAVCHVRGLTIDDGDCKVAEEEECLSVLNWADGYYNPPKSMGNLSSLEELTFNDCAFFSLSHSLSQLKSLRLLTIRCPQITTLPESFGNLSSLETLDLEFCYRLASLPRSFGQLTSLKNLTISHCYNLWRLPLKFGQLESLKDLSILNCKRLRVLSDDIGCLTSLTTLRALECDQLDGKTMDRLAEIKSLLFFNISMSPLLIERWEQIKEQQPLLVISNSEYDQDHMEEFKRMMRCAFFQGERRWVQVDSGGELVEWSAGSSFVDGQAKVGVLFTMGDFCSPSESEGLRIVREKCSELLRKNFPIIYVEVVGVGELREQSEEHIRQALLALPPGIIALLGPDKKTSQLFAFSAYKALGFICNEHRDLELKGAFDAVSSFLVEVKINDCQQGDDGGKVYFGRKSDGLFSPLQLLWRKALSSD